MSSETANMIVAFATIVVAIFTGLLALFTYWLYQTAKNQLGKLSDQIKASQEQIRTSQAQLVAAQEAENAANTRHQEALEKERERLRETETLRNCCSFDTDPIIVGACRRVWRASENGKHYSPDKVAEHDVIIMCNYLDGLAIGVREGNFDEKIVRAHLGQMITKAVDTIIPAVFKDDTSGYEALHELRERFRGPS